MPMTVSFELSDTDLAHFRRIILEAREASKNLGPEAIIEGAEKLVTAVSQGDVPDFISDRVAKLKSVIAMLDDEDWGLPPKDRRKVMNGLAYFTHAEDLIPDTTPILGFLDDAIMVELLTEGLQFEIEAYEAFCAFRDDVEKQAAIHEEAKEKRAEDLKKEREKLLVGMRNARDRAARAERTTGGAKVTFFD